MRIYSEPMEMVREVERDLFEMGVRYQSATVQDQNVKDDPGFQTIELSGYAYALTGFDSAKLKAMIAYLGNNEEWAKAEFVERMGIVPMNPGFAWMKDPDKWGKFLRDGSFSYTYSERLCHQIKYVVHELKTRPNTRQAIMTMYDVHQDLMNWGGRDRVPCSLTYQFLLRGNELTLIYNQRSCDFKAFFSTDVAITVNMLRYVAKQIEANPVRFVHFIGSLHAFAKDLEGRNIF